MCDGTWGYTLNADYGARTVSISAFIATVNINDNTNTVLDYSALNGNAAFSQQTTFFPAGCTPATCAYTWTFANADGAPAGQVTGSVVFTSATESGVGDPLVATP
jgi:hypothetical protein